MSALPPSFWSALESVPGASALHTIWKRHLGPDLEAFTTIFLKPRPGEPAEFVPCPWNSPCGCSHKVVPRDNGTLAGICQCSPPHCGEYTVMPEERVPWDLDWPKLGRALCRAFGLDFKIAQLGLFNTLQIGTWPPSSIATQILNHVSRFTLHASRDI